MSKKQKFTAEELVTIVAGMKSIMAMSGNERETYIAQTIGAVYDYEIPVPAVIESISRFAVRGNRPEDNHVYYMTPTSVDKKVFTLTSNCNVTQLQVTPNTRTELELVPIITNDYWICLSDFLSGDHNALELYADSIGEALDRYEIKNVLMLLDAAAVAESNTFTDDSGNDAIDYLKIVDMARSLARYGTSFVLITGANVTTDLLKMDYNANTFREYGLENLRIKHIPIEALTVDTNSSGQDAVIDADVAYLVAVSDAMKQRSILVARQSVALAADMADTKVVEKQRLVIDTGNMKNVGATVKFARGKAGYEEFGAVIINSKTVAKYTKS